MTARCVKPVDRFVLQAEITSGSASLLQALHAPEGPLWIPVQAKPRFGMTLGGSLDGTQWHPVNGPAGTGMPVKRGNHWPVDGQIQEPAGAEYQRASVF